MNNTAVRQVMPAVSFNEEVEEHTNSLRYLGIHFHRMQTYRTQVDSMKLREKGQSAVEAKATKGIEQRHVFLFSKCS